MIRSRSSNSGNDSDVVLLVTLSQPFQTDPVS